MWSCYNILHFDVKKKNSHALHGNLRYFTVKITFLLSELDQLQEKYTNLEKELQKSTKVWLKKSRKLSRKVGYL